jgi:hypothetical protein
MALGGVRARGAAARFGRRARIRWSRRMARALSAFVALSLALAVVAAGALYLRLTRGPIPLDGLAARIEAAANAELDGLTLSLGGARLSLGEPGGVDPRPGLRFEALHVRDANGDTLFSAPSARVEVRPLDLLLGAVRPTRIVVTGADLRIRREPDGRFGLGVGGAAQAGGAPISSEAGPLAALREVRFIEAGLVYDDRLSGRVWSAERATASLSRAGAGFDAALRATLSDGLNRPFPVTLAARIGADRGFTARAAFDALSPSALAAQLPALAALRAVEAAAAGDVFAAVDPDGALTALDLDLRFGAGRVRVEGETLALNSARIALEFDPAAGRFALRQADAVGPLGRISAEGAARLTRGTNGAVAGAVAQLRIAELAVAAPELYAEPAVFDGGAVTARIGLAPLSIDLAELTLRRGAMVATVSGRAALGDAGWEGALSATASDAALDDVLALWPASAAPGARRWVAENMEAARIDRVAAQAALRDGAADFAMNFAFSDAIGHYLRPMPPITGGAGWGELNADRFALTLAEGAVALGDAGPVDLSGSAFVLPSLSEPLPPAAIAVRGRGPLATILSALDSEPLGLVRAFGLEPDAVAGRAEAEARLSVPLLKGLALDQVGAAIGADLIDVALTPPGLPLRLEGDALRLDADIDGLRVTGPARIDGIPARLDWRETFAPAPGAPRRVAEIAATLSEARLVALGVDPRGALTGTVGVTAVLRDFDDATQFRIDADLTEAALAVDAVDWSKPPGAPAQAVASGSAAERVTIELFAVEAPGLQATGSAVLDSAGDLERIAFERLSIGDAVDLAVEAALEDDRTLAIISSGRLDLSALELGGGDGRKALRLRFDLDRLALGAAGALSPARGFVSLARDGGVELELAGDLEGRAPAALVYSAPATGPGMARLSSEDAGALLRAAGVFEDGVGGALLLDATVDLAEGYAAQGSATIDDFLVVDDRAIRELIAEVEPSRAAALAEGEGIRFARVSTDFDLTPERLRVSDGVAIGPALGVTLEGEYQMAADRLDMRGVLTPAYQLNAALGGIPIIGDLLTGGEGEGVFGVNFALTGPSADPEITVQPLSALLPGAFRQLLQASDPEAIAEGRRRFEEMRRLREFMQ